MDSSHTDTEIAHASMSLGTRAHMRRIRQELSTKEALGMLADHTATSGILALNDPDFGAPYTVPMSYVYAPTGTGPQVSGTPCSPDVSAVDGTHTRGVLGSVYFHGSPRGRKVELIAQDDRASFCVVAADEVVQEEFATHYRSVVATGHLEVVHDDAERMAALRLLGHTYSPDLPPSATEDEIAGAFAHTCVLALRIEQVSAKEAKALADARRKS